jgi:hypothetical protein
MSVVDVSKALRHVHNQLDVEKQWVRAIGGLAPMTHLQRAQVWADLSSHTLSMDAQRAPVVLSQYKALYKAALKEIDARRGGGGGVCDESEGAVWDMLKEYKKALETFKLLALTIQDTSSGRQVVDMGNNAGNPISTELMKNVMEKLEALAIRVTQLQDGNLSIAQLILDHQASISAIKSKLEAVAAQTEESVKVQETMNQLQGMVESSSAKQTEHFKIIDDYMKSKEGAYQNVTQFESRLDGLLTDMVAIKTKMVDLDELLEQINPKTIIEKWTRLQTNAMQKIQESINSAAGAAATAKDCARQASIAAQRAERKAGPPK